MIGQKILHYKILEKLGEGGMGAVYKAEDTKLKRNVAIKFLPGHIADSSEERKRFQIEAQATAALNHPNIATIHAIEEVDDEIFIVLEFIPGKELKSHINGSPLPLEETIDIATQIASGLKAAHKHDIIHRDIKSANIMINEDGVVKIMDFGLAKVAGSAVHLTKDQTTLGTAGYMSPEQTTGAPVDHRTDIWALGVVLYEMLTGQMPFRGEYEQAIVYSIINEDPEPMTNVTPNIEQIIMKALAKNPDERYQSVDELARDLRAIGHEQSGRKKPILKQPKLAWMIASAVVMIVASALYFFLPPSKPAGGAVKTIAVLPFADMSPNKDQEYFSDGLAEALLNELVRNPGLRVTSRTSAFSFKGKDINIKTIAQTLNVKHILEGSVRKAGNNLRITAQLIDVETDVNRWSQTYDGTLDNIFALQDSISASVAEALQIALLGKESATHQTETAPEAYNAYLLGKHFHELDGKENLEKAVGYFKKALSIDAGYAPAWVCLSSTHIDQANYGYLPVYEGYRKSRQEVEKALELDPNLADAHSQMGKIKHVYDWDWNGAEKSHQRALELEPGNANIIKVAARLAGTLGRFDEAMTLLRRSIELDPVRTSLYYNLGLQTWYAGLLDESITAFKKCLELTPQYLGAHTSIGLVYLAKGQADSALAKIERETEPAWKMYGLALVYHAMGKKEEADEALVAYINEYQDGWAYQIAEIYAYRGEANKAFAWLERAYLQRDGGLTEIKGDPLLHNIEQDPRYTAFLMKMKLPLYDSEDGV